MHALMCQAAAATSMPIRAGETGNETGARLPTTYIARMDTHATAENRLANETSPYLLQHKTNPVDWWPWGEEALAEAQRTGKPILLSVGYAACHWCHVMAHESFEDVDTAAVMNALFVNISTWRRCICWASRAAGR